MGHSIHNIDINKPLTHTTPYMLSAICPVQWKPACSQLTLHELVEPGFKVQSARKIYLDFIKKKNWKARQKSKKLILAI